MMFYLRAVSLLLRWNIKDVVLPRLNLRWHFLKYVDRVAMSSLRPYSAAFHDGLLSRMPGHPHTRTSSTGLKEGHRCRC